MSRELIAVLGKEPNIMAPESIHPDDRERVHRGRERALASEAAYDIDFRIVDRGGATLWGGEVRADLGVLEVDPDHAVPLVFEVRANAGADAGAGAGDSGGRHGFPVNLRAMDAQELFEGLA